MIPRRVLYAKPSITEREVRYAEDAARSGWGDNCYDYIVRFEREFARLIGTDFAHATSSCTGALHLALAALGVGPGDEVIVPDSTWVATAAAVCYTGAKPILVDVNLDDWCIDPKRVEEALSERTKAVVVVHLYGNVANIEALKRLCDSKGIFLIEDAAEAIGSSWHGRPAGGLADVGVFSFHGTKTMTTGEGGMLVTNSARLYERAMTLNAHGRSRLEVRQFWPGEVGFKYKMSNIQAAIGLAQLERIDVLLARKREIFEYYKSALAGLSVLMNPEPPGVVNGFWMPTVVFSNAACVSRERLLEVMRARGIDARVFFWPLSTLPMFKGNMGNTVSSDLASRSINLPSYHDMTDEDQDWVIEAVFEAAQSA